MLPTDALTSFLNDYYLQTLALAAFPDLNITIHPDIKYMPNKQALVMKKAMRHFRKDERSIERDEQGWLFD